MKVQRLSLGYTVVYQQEYGLKLMRVGENPLNGNAYLRRYSLIYYGDIVKFIRELQSVANSVKKMYQIS